MTPSIFNAVAYFKQVHGELKLLKSKYKFEPVSGINELEGVLQGSRRHNYFLAIDDSQDGVTFRGAGAGYYERRPYTVFILGKADYGDMQKRSEVLSEAKSIYRHLLSRMIHDKLSIPVLNLEQTRFYEVPPAFATGCSGLYFTFNVEIPVNLSFDASAWEFDS